MIETERLRLRRWTQADREPYRAMSADPRVMATLGGVSTGPAFDTRFANLAGADPVGLAILAVERRGDGRFIGYCGLKRIPDSKPAALVGEAEIAWGLVHDAWGQGFAREAAAAMLARHRHRAVWAYTARINARSEGLMIRLGMERRPAHDFDNADVPADSPLRPHIVYLRPAG